MTRRQGQEVGARWPAPTPSDRELEALAGRELLRHARRVGRRRVRARLAVDALVRDALREMDADQSQM